MNEFNDEDTEAEIAEAPAASAAPSQADLYDALKRIGELEDQKNRIQAEIDGLTAELTAAIPAIDSDSLLYQMLVKTFPPVKKSAPAKKTPAKKSTKKKPAIKK